VQPASASAPKTQDTSGRLSQPELLQCDQVAVSLKTSRDISALGFPTCCKTWQEWVTERRGAWRQRVNAARLISGSGSLSWPTARTNDCQAGRPNDGKDRIGPNGERYGLNLSDKVIAEANWPTANARDWKDSGPTQGNRQNPNLGTAVVKDAANWLTPQSGDVTGSTREAVVMWANGQRPKTSDQRLRTQVAAEQLKHGQAAPASSSSLGSRQGLWLTPRANEPDSDPNFAARNADRGAHCHGTLSSQAKEMWPTITAHTPDMESNGPNGHQGTYLAGAVKQWATPRSGKTTDENPETWALRQAKGDVATMPLGAQVKCWGTPAANDANKQNVMCEVNSKQAGLPKSVGLELQRQWGTPTARDHKSGRGNNEREYKELTPMVERQQSGKLNPRWVETLMGLPIGWTMPSCTSPQTIAPMSCDSSAMELCQQPQSEPSEFSLGSWPSPRLNENQQTEELGLLWAENGFKQPKTRGGKARANGSTFDVTLETAARGVAAMEAKQ
jgi:hypothetical protein